MTGSPMRWWRALAIACAAATVLAVDARLAAAAPESCVAAARAFTCDPLPEDREQRRAVLGAWDAAARAAVTEHRLRDAARLFSCLLLVDTRPEHASNLSVALKQSGDLPSALAAAKCAEQLNVESSEAQARARARREAIERLLAALIPGAAPPVAAAPATSGADNAAPPAVTEAPAAVRAPALDLSARPPADTALRDRPRAADPAPQIVASGAELSPARPHRLLVRVATVALAGALLAGATVAYVAAHNDASRFHQEQTANGYTTRAEGLKEDAQMWQSASIGGFVGAGLAGLAAAITW